MAFKENIQSFVMSQISSFNPCFSGYGLQSFLNRLRTDSVLVSILVFLDMAFKVCAGRCWCWCNGMFQSLFFWIWPSKWSHIFYDYAKVLFQSLFFWIWPSKRAIISDLRDTFAVSILVFLDMAFKARIENRLNIIHLVSILVFLDMAFKGAEWLACSRS